MTCTDVMLIGRSYQRG